MAQTTLFPPAEIPDVQPGDVFQLGGRHRLMCGDATDKAAVAHLFGDDAPTLVVTSPPYLAKRDYDSPIACWETLIFDALDVSSVSADIQMLINLGVVHKDNEWVPYWLPWMTAMKKVGWRIHAQYPWDKTTPSPGHFGARLLPSHEFVFHLNKISINANKWVESARSGFVRASRDISCKKGKRKIRKVSIKASHRVPLSVIRIKPVNTDESSGHPAQMPKGLAVFLIRTWKKPSCITYDPFGGSGTTILAAEAEDVTGLAMEISEKYCQIALRRWAKEHPDKPIRKL